MCSTGEKKHSANLIKISLLFVLFQMKTEIKEEALDFSSTTVSENHQSDSVTPSSGTNNSIEEEARMYLDAFTRSANLSWQQTPDEPMVSLLIDHLSY